MIFRLLFVLISLTMFPFSTEAISTKDLNFRVVKNISNYCPSVNTLACFNPNTQEMTIKANLNEAVLKVVLAHELYHFFTQDTEFYLDEHLANEFYFFIYFPALVTDKVKIFFTNLILKVDTK